MCVSLMHSDIYEKSVSADSQLGSQDQYYLLRQCYSNPTTSEVDSVAASLLLLHKVF